MNAVELALKIGKTIKLNRLIKELTRSQLSDISGVKTLTIQRMESGQGSALGLDNLLPILDALDIDVAKFFYEIRSKDSQKILASDQSADSTIDLYQSIQNMPDMQKNWIKKLISNMKENIEEKI